VTLESAEAILEFAPEDVVDRIAPRPLLLVHGDRDSLVSIEEPESAPRPRAASGSGSHVVAAPGTRTSTWATRSRR
jgi:fermentation-respiration switch protein FrsA (DUF1100 family)